MLKIYGFPFLSEIFPLRLRPFKFRLSVKFSGLYYWFLCRSFLICLPVCPLPLTYSQQVGWHPVLTMFSLSLSLSKSAVWPQPTFLAELPLFSLTFPGSLGSSSECRWLCSLSWPGLVCCPVARVHLLPASHPFIPAPFLWHPFRSRSHSSWESPFFLHAPFSVTWESHLALTQVASYLVISISW